MNYPLSINFLYYCFKEYYTVKFLQISIDFVKINICIRDINLKGMYLGECYLLNYYGIDKYI